MQLKIEELIADVVKIRLALEKELQHLPYYDEYEIKAALAHAEQKLEDAIHANDSIWVTVRDGIAHDIEPIPLGVTV